MKLKGLGLMVVVLFTLPVYASKVIGSRVGANEKSAGFFIEAFSSKGRVLYKSIKLDENGKFEIDFVSNEPLVYWIDNYPVFVKPNEDLEIVLPEKRSNVFVLGGDNQQKSIVTTDQKGSANIQIAGKSLFNNLMISEIETSWGNFVKEKKGLQTVEEINGQYGLTSKLIKSSKDAEVNKYATFYNNFRFLESKIQYLRTHPERKVDKNYFDVLNKISLSDPAVNSLKIIGLRALVNNYYAFLKLSQGAKITDDDLSDNGSIGKMDYLLKNASSERIINEELNQSIIYHLSIKGWNPELDKIMVAAIERITDSAAKKNLIELREKYSKVSKNAIAPAFSIPDAAGKLVNLNDFKGKVVAIDVWATWCIPCMHSLPYFLKLRDKYKDNQDVVFMSISTDNAKSKEKWLAFLKSKGMNGIDLHAGDETATPFEKAYNITGIPRYILIDKQGKIIEDHAPQASEPEYEALIQTALQTK
ncbi:TlpA disulfide reductase family protein [Pedobacter miscanthi]|uniref:TlpA family protein disulfide reductase n=1 Tax=Pedobacter miscanthi TaxID=2259170 RepID=UPI00292E745B|nr:TlpA disulfide reductase family protein [Pedobacter miscanthi]